MSKMQEAWLEFAEKEGYDQQNPYAKRAVEFGYQAAIAAVTEGGAQAWIEHHKGGDNLNWEQVDHAYAKSTPLYKLPED